MGLRKKQDSGSRCQVTGAGAMLNSELRIVGCELPSYFWPPPTAFCLLPTAFEDLAGRFASSASKDKMSPHAWRENRSKFKK